MMCIGDRDEMVGRFTAGKQVRICVYCDRSTENLLDCLLDRIYAITDLPW